jgi:secreted trypsin-like serine protease
MLLLFAPACIDPGAAASATREDAITGGTPDNIKQVPWQVSLQAVTVGQHFCGGVIIDERHVLTARHCTTLGKNESNSLVSHLLRVAAGMTKLSQISEEAQVREVEEIFPLNHAWQFDHDTAGGDLALMRLTQPLHFNSKVRPIEVATLDDERAGRTGPGVLANVSGWGQQSTKGPISDQLLAVDVPIVPLEIAERVDPKKRQFAPELIAAGGVTGKDSCNGDSGGPLVVKGCHGRPLLAGVVSFGIDEVNIDCGAPGIPGIYQSVAKYADLIDRFRDAEADVLARRDGVAGKNTEVQQILAVDVPAGVTELDFDMFGGTGDADLMVKRGAPPTSRQDADCYSGAINSNDETCNFANPQAGTYYIALLGFADYADAKIRVNAYNP